MQPLKASRPSVHPSVYQSILSDGILRSVRLPLHAHPAAARLVLHLQLRQLLGGELPQHQSRARQEDPRHAAGPPQTSARRQRPREAAHAEPQPGLRPPPHLSAAVGTGPAALQIRNAANGPDVYHRTL